MVAFIDQLPHSQISDKERRGVVGPNAVTRLAQALNEMQGLDGARSVFSQAGLLHYLEASPTHMVDERDVAKLHFALRQTLGPMRSGQVSRRAGELTGDYLLAHRLPKVMQRVLRCLPMRLAAILLVEAMSRHAWTFTGSGLFSYRLLPHLRLTIRGAPICRLIESDSPVCQYYEATFERLFTAILGQRASVVETQCEAQGEAACTYTVSW